MNQCRKTAERISTWFCQWLKTRSGLWPTTNDGSCVSTKSGCRVTSWHLTLLSSVLATLKTCSTAFSACPVKARTLVKARSLPRIIYKLFEAFSVVGTFWLDKVCTNTFWNLIHVKSLKFWKAFVWFQHNTSYLLQVFKNNISKICCSTVATILTWALAFHFL